MLLPHKPSDQIVGDSKGGCLDDAGEDSRPQFSKGRRPNPAHRKSENCAGRGDKRTTKGEERTEGGEEGWRVGHEKKSEGEIRIGVLTLLLHIPASSPPVATQGKAQDNTRR